MGNETHWLIFVAIMGFVIPYFLYSISSTLMDIHNVLKDILRWQMGIKKMNEMKHDPEHIEAVAKAIGEVLYGYVDKNDTPNTWQMSIDLAKIAINKWEEINLKIVTGGLD